MGISGEIAGEKVCLKAREVEDRVPHVRERVFPAEVLSGESGWKRKK